MNICMFSEDEWGNSLAPDDERCEHIRGILKLNDGDRIKVGCIGHGIGTGSVAQIDDGSGHVSINFPDFDQLEPRAGADVQLIIGHPRPPVFQRLLKDLSSMGLKSISWVRSELTEKSYLASRAWQEDAVRSQIRRGLEQGGMSRIPEIEKYYSLHACLEQLGPGDADIPRFVLHADAASTNLAVAVSGIDVSCGGNNGPSLILAIGPERGWTDAELEQFSERDFHSAHMGPAVLRTENAAVIAAGLCQMQIRKAGEQ